MKTILALFISLLTAQAIALTAEKSALASRPNIVVILSDDYGYGSLGCYGADAKLIQTPALDRLAREGRRFTDANTTSSVCSPTRYSVMTGRYCWRTSLTHEVLGTFSPLHIETNRLNMASLLKAHGYTSAAIGKWHLGYGTSDESPKWRTDYTAELSPGPLDLGFDYHFGVPSNHGDLTGVFVENRFVYGLRSEKIPENMKVRVTDSDDFKTTYTATDMENAKSGVKILDLDAPRRKNERVMKVLTDKATQWIEQQPRDKPFFLYFTPVAVHNPVTPDKDIAGKSAAGLYGDWIHELDRSVGRILETLDKQGLAKNTLVIFSSDNGGVKEPQKADSPQTLALTAGLAVNGPWRSGKHHIWEGGFRVPFLVRWPGQAPAGTVCNETISLADILATTAAIVGEKLPPAQKGAEDSFNILPAIRGEQCVAPLRPDIIVHSADGVFAIRKGQWKWIEGIPVEDIKAGARKARVEEYRAQLYDLKNDPAETKDVSAAHPDVVKELSGLLDRYREGGYSRALPPPPAAQHAGVELPPVASMVVLDDAFDKVPGAPWVLVRGKWIAKEGAVWGSEKAADQAVAAMRYPLKQSDGDIRYELSLPNASGHTLRVAGKIQDQVLLIQISSRRVAIADQSSGKILAQSPAKFQAKTWLPVRACFRGNELTVQVADVTAKATSPLIAGPKTAFALLAHGEEIGFRKVQVNKAP